MIELRSPLPEELDEMLAVMCEAFNLPFGPARDVYYKDPYFDVRRKRVLIADGKIVSCLTVVDAPLWIGRAVVPVAGVAGVATCSDARNRGYASRLLEDAVPALRELEYGLAALFAVSASFYKRLDWEPASPQIQLSLSPTAINVTREGRYVRAALPSDTPDLLRLYDAWSRERTGCRLRDDKRWRYLGEHVKHRVVYKRQAVEGYALYDTRENTGSRPTLRLLELVAETESAQRGLHSHLAQRTDCERIEYTSGWREIGESGLLRSAVETADDAGVTMHLIPGPLVHVIDFKRCLLALKDNWTGFDGSVTLVLRDSPGDRQSAESVTLDGSGGEVEVRPGNDRDNPRARIEGDSCAWAAVAVGRMSLADAVAAGRLRATSDAAAAKAAPLFPRRALAIPAADHF